MKANIENNVIIDGVKIVGNKSKVEYTHAVVQERHGNGEKSIDTLCKSYENAVKGCKRSESSCKRMIKDGYSAGHGWVFTVHPLVHN